MNGSNAALSLEHVGKRFPKGTVALKDATLSVGYGARACLLGPNGAGKSTTIRLLQGALEPTSGRVSLLGAPVNGPGYLAARRRTGIVPQGPGMYSDVTVDEYLDLVWRLYGRGDVARVKALFGLDEHRDKMLVQLSGGFQRRVVMAAALLGEPDLLLLDEPTVGLDPVAAHEIHALLRDSMAGRTTLLCTHNLAEAEALCDEVIILRDGSVLLHEPLDQLRQRAHPGVRLAVRQGVAALLAALRTRGLEAHGDGEDGAIATLDDPEQETPALLRGLLADGLDVYECRPMRASLESLFLDIVRQAA